MSRIGKLPITVPAGVEVKMEDGIVTVKGPKGTLTQDVRPEVKVDIAPGVVTVTRFDDEKASKASYQQHDNWCNTGIQQGPSD